MPAANLSGYPAISKVLFLFKQHSPKIEFGLRRMPILSQLCRDYNMLCILGYNL